MASRQAPFSLPLLFGTVVTPSHHFLFGCLLPAKVALHTAYMALVAPHLATSPEYTQGLDNRSSQSSPKESSDPWIRQALRRTSAPVGDVLEPFHTLSPHCKPHSSMSSGPWYSEIVPHKPNRSCGSQVCSLVSGDTERVTKHVLAASATSWRWPCIP